MSHATFFCCTPLPCRFGQAFDYIDTCNPEQRYNAAELDSPSCHYSTWGCLYQGGALTALEKSFVQACIAEDPAQRWTVEQLLEHPYLAQ
jgi:serine/threonine protein kinase